MGGDNNGDEIGFKHGDETEISRLGITSMPLYTKPDSFFSSADWDPLVSNSHYTSLVTNCFPHFTPVSGSSYCEIPANLLPFRPGESHEAHQISDDGVLSTSQSRKRKQLEAASVSTLQWNKKAVDEIQEDYTEDQSEKNLKTEQSKERKETMNKESSQSGNEAPKENYIHMRARRGQATNSHSLAERVRREKISERMRLLQELVPGCNKITGKAVMLDEIINYVQSLQQQVEFLSMKLATVNPELDKIIAKDLLQSRDRNTSTLGLTPGLNPFTIFQGIIPNISTTTNPQYNSLHQTTVDSELHNLYQMGFVSNPSTVSTFSPNALSGLKPEL